MSIKLEVGKKYKTREGKIVEVIKHTGEELILPFSCDDGWRRGEFGNFAAYGQMHNKDAVEEVTETTDQTAVKIGRDEALNLLANSILSEYTYNQLKEATYDSIMESLSRKKVKELDDLFHRYGVE